MKYELTPWPPLLGREGGAKDWEVVIFLKISELQKPPSLFKRRGLGNEFSETTTYEKHNEDSGITWALKNIALGVTTNKVRFHIDYCTRSIAEILSFRCLKDKMVLHIGEAAKISTVSVLGSQLAFDNRIFFSTDPVAMDRIGLDILEQKRLEQKLDSIRDISTHIA